MDINKFKAPGSVYRPVPFWSWNDKLDKEELRRQIREMAGKGWGGFFMHSRVGLVTGYLSDEWMEMIRTCAMEAKDTGIYALLYDEDKWPSGFAGGKVAENEAYRSRALVLLKEDELTDNDTVLAKCTYETCEYFICKRITAMGNLWFNGASYVDLMNPEAVRCFIKYTHEKYKEACGEYFGNVIPGVFTDEPCFLRPKDYSVPVLPWSDYLPGFFYELKGYLIEEHLPELFFETGDYRRIRFDFFDTATKLFLESFSKQYYEWCEANSLRMTGHFMAEDSLLSQSIWIGAAMPHYEFMHWPGIDKLARNITQIVTVKQLTSVADQLGKERALSEAFGCVGQHVSFYHRKWIADWQAALGINFVTHHLSLYSMRGERKRDYPANLFYQQPWWNNEKGFADYIGRLSYVGSVGKRDVEILVLHTVSSTWSEYSPLKKEEIRATETGGKDIFAELSRSLAANKLDFHFGDEIIMGKHGRVADKKLIIGQCSYSSVVVPPCLTLRKSTVKLLVEFANAAGPDRVIFMRPFPQRVDGMLAVSGVEGNMTEMQWPEGLITVASINEVISVLNGFYTERIRITDKLTGQNADRILCHQRSSQEGKWIFLANTDEKREIYTDISVQEQVKLYVLDLSSGEVYKLPVSYQNGRTVLSMKFLPAGSIVLFMPAVEIEAREVPVYLDSGVSFETGHETIQILNDFDVSLSDSNALALNSVTLYLNGQLMMEEQPVVLALYKHFYKAPEGTPFKAEYYFDVLNVPSGEIFAVIEVAENLESIFINGTRVSPLKAAGESGSMDTQKSWLDLNFTKVPITGMLKKGRNKLTLFGKKSNNITGPGTHTSVHDYKYYRPTEVETVYIIGNFSVKSENDERFLIDKVVEPAANDLTASGYPFYTGSAEFSTKFYWKASYGRNETYPGNIGLCHNSGETTASKKVYLKINNVNAACISLKINGKDAGLKYWEPFVYDVTGLIVNGENSIKLKAFPTLFNLTGPNNIVDIINDKYVGPRTFVDINRFTAKYSLMPFGIGSVSLITHDNISVR